MLGQLCVLASTLSIVFGQQCQKSNFDGFNTCLNNSINQCLSTINQASSNVTLQEQCRNCFKKQRCQEPDFNNSHSTPEEKQHDMLSNMFPNVTRKVIMECIVQVGESIQKDVDVCVSDTYPGFSSLSIRNIAGMLGLDSKGILLKVIEALSKCDKYQEVGFCMMDAVRKNGMQNPMETFCNDAKACVKTLNESCNTVQVRSALCNCANKILTFGKNGNATKYVDQFYKCINKPAPNQKTYAQKFGGFAKMLVQKICTGDFCQEQVSGQHTNSHEQEGHGVSHSNGQTGNSHSNGQSGNSHPNGQSGNSHSNGQSGNSHPNGQSANSNPNSQSGNSHPNGQSGNSHSNGNQHHSNGQD